jgi:hypothetical protein
MRKYLRIETLGLAQKMPCLCRASASAKAWSTLIGAGFGSEDGGIGIPPYREVKKLC